MFQRLAAAAVAQRSSHSYSIIILWIYYISINDVPLSLAYHTERSNSERARTARTRKKLERKRERATSPSSAATARPVCHRCSPLTAIAPPHRLLPCRSKARREQPNQRENSIYKKYIYITPSNNNTHVQFFQQNVAFV